MVAVFQWNADPLHSFMALHYPSDWGAEWPQPLKRKFVPMEKTNNL